MSKAYFKPQKYILGSYQPFRFSLLNSTVLPAMLQIRFLQQQKTAAVKNKSSYQSAMYQNQDPIQELQWWSTTWRFAMAN